MNLRFRVRLFKHFLHVLFPRVFTKGDPQAMGEYSLALERENLARLKRERDEFKKLYMDREGDVIMSKSRLKLMEKIYDPDMVDRDHEFENPAIQGEPGAQKRSKCSGGFTA